VKGEQAVEGGCVQTTWLNEHYMAKVYGCATAWRLMVRSQKVLLMIDGKTAEAAAVLPVTAWGWFDGGHKIAAWTVDMQKAAAVASQMPCAGNCMSCSITL